MGKTYVSQSASTQADRVRELLGEAEKVLPRLRGAGSQVVSLLGLIDHIVDALEPLEAAGADVRAERRRLEGVQQRLRRHKRRFLTEAGRALQTERAAAQPPRERWWWYLDELLAQESKERLRRILTRGAIVLVLLAVGWLVYDRFFAPPPEVREALQLRFEGQTLFQEGNLEEALAKYEAATDLVPDEAEYWVWVGALRSELGRPDDAQLAFETARALYGADYDFWLQRGQVYLLTGDLDAASADIERAITEKPDGGAAYYVRASVDLELEDYDAALEDLERASELANQAGDVRLEAAARQRFAMVIQLRAAQGSDVTLTPTP